MQVSASKISCVLVINPPIKSGVNYKQSDNGAISILAVMLSDITVTNCAAKMRGEGLITPLFRSK